MPAQFRTILRNQLDTDLDAERNFRVALLLLHDAAGLKDDNKKQNDLKINNFRLVMKDWKRELEVPFGVLASQSWFSSRTSHSIWRAYYRWPVFCLSWVSERRCPQVIWITWSIRQSHFSRLWWRHQKSHRTWTIFVIQQLLFWILYCREQSVLFRA